MDEAKEPRVPAEPQDLPFPQSKIFIKYHNTSKTHLTCPSMGVVNSVVNSTLWIVINTNRHDDLRHHGACLGNVMCHPSPLSTPNSVLYLAGLIVGLEAK